MAYRRNSTDADIQSLLDWAIEGFFGLSRRAQLWLIALCVAGAIIALAVYLQRQREAQFAAGASRNLLLGNPSGASTGLLDRDNYLMDKGYFVLAYDSSRGTPKWVSWQVTADDLGHARRKQTFDTDMTLPAGFARITSHDYAGSGFDRGHMCPHSDRAADEQMSFATFIMTNIIPQAPNVNEKAWAQLEMYSRQLVQNGNHLYIISGPLGRGGIGSKGFREVIAKGQVTVPAQCWKVIVIVPVSGGLDDLAKINANTRVIAVIMPNNQEIVGEEWAQYRTSADQIERQTGLRFFDRLPPNVAQTLRQKVDTMEIPQPRSIGRGMAEMTGGARWQKIPQVMKSRLKRAS
jgi:endonuclease G